MIIGISGLAGSGKSVLADIIANEYNYAVVALADPIKRITKEIFNFSDDQLWGPSEKRGELDSRYNISPRQALQKLGTEYGRGCYKKIWVDYTLRTIKKIMETKAVYDPKIGLVPSYNCKPYAGVIVSDIRFYNEHIGLRQAGAMIVRIKRPGHEQPAWQHESETEQMTITDNEFDYVIKNNGNIDDLKSAVKGMFTELSALNDILLKEI